MDVEIISSPKIPDVVTLNSGHVMPVVASGTFDFQLEPGEAKEAIIEAMKVGYRHFDTASVYGSEGVLGQAIAEAIRLGLIESRSEVFVTSKLWCTDNHPDRVIPAILSSLRKLKMDYLDMYLMHWPMSATPGPASFPVKRDDVVPLDLRGVWAAMEECRRLGLTRSIGVSNFTTKKLEELLQFAKLPPAVNQVEMNPGWQQQKLKQYCLNKGIFITGYSPLGGQISFGNPNPIMTCDVLKEIAAAKRKTIAQISLRWILEQEVGIVVKSFNKRRLRENLKIFDWELSKEELLKIRSIPQKKAARVEFMLTEEGCLSVDISDIDIIED